MIGCGLAVKTAHMDDGEFWAFVFNVDDDRVEPDIDDVPDMTTQDCIRCGEPIIVTDWEEACDRMDDSFCDECADAHLPDADVQSTESQGEN